MAIFFPVNTLNTRIERSFNTTARYVPFGLILKLSGLELADNNLRYSAYILQVYFKFVGKSNVRGSHIYKNPL